MIVNEFTDKNVLRVYESSVSLDNLHQTFGHTESSWVSLTDNFQVATAGFTSILWLEGK